MLYIDLETRSECDLIFHGLRRYAEHPSTELICAAYAVDDEPMKFFWANEPFPAGLREYLAGGGLIYAHNAQFERELFDFVLCNDYDLPPIEPSRWRCSMVQALTNGHPASLGQLAHSLDLPIQKQTEGTRLIRQYCAPGFVDIFDVPADMDAMKTYCVYDVEVMRAAIERMRALTDSEWAEYHLTETMNERGIPVDVTLAEAVLGYSKEITEDADAEIYRITNGAMHKHTQRTARDQYILPRLTQHQKKLITVYKKGEEKLSFDREHRGYLLEDEDLDVEVFALLEQIDNAGSSSLTKFATAAHTHAEGLVHHTLQYHGAQTGRFTSRGLQIHNMIRDAYGDNAAERLIADICAGEPVERPAQSMARLARALLWQDTGLYYVDWSSIEGRVAPWISQDPQAQPRLDLFAAGGDIYVAAVREMLGLRGEVSGDQRQIGKVAELSLGYGGGVGALSRMAKNYGMIFTQQEASDIVRKWRDANRWATDIWAAFERAARAAVETPLTPHTAGRCTYQSDGSYLWCALPSGRLLAYPKPLVEFVDDPFGGAYKATFQTSTKPGKDAVGRIRKPLRGALIYQNAVQGAAACLLREALVRAHAAGLDIRWHVHDEIVGIGTLEHGNRLNDLMLEAPAWADGLPLATGGVKWGRRWGK